VLTGLLGIEGILGTADELALLGPTSPDTPCLDFGLFGKLFTSKDLGFVRAKKVELDTPHEKTRLAGGVTVAAAWRPHTGEFCLGAAAPP
jgi:hypothetical protein